MMATVGTWEFVPDGPTPLSYEDDRMTLEITTHRGKIDSIVVIDQKRKLAYMVFMSAVSHTYIARVRPWLELKAEGEPMLPDQLRRMSHLMHIAVGYSSGIPSSVSAHWKDALGIMDQLRGIDRSAQNRRRHSPPGRNRKTQTPRKLRTRRLRNVA